MKIEDKQVAACGLDSALAVIGGKWKSTILWNCTFGQVVSARSVGACPASAKKSFSSSFDNSRLMALFGVTLSTRSPCVSNTR